ncbi:hypothetical protein DITRI_Ditri02bG0150500 [Diplodiscus trichospermus]
MAKKGKKKKEWKKTKKTKNQGKEKDIARELTRMLRELLVFYKEQPAPQVKAVVDKETGLEKQTVERFIKQMLEEKPARAKAKTMATVALWCVQYLPEARPSMRNVVKILEGGAEAANPPNPFQHFISSANVPSCMVSISNSTTDYDEDDRDDTTIMRKYEIQYATSYLYIFGILNNFLVVETGLDYVIIGLLRCYLLFMCSFVM